MRRVWLLNLVLAGALAVAGARLWSFVREPLPALPGGAPPAQQGAAEAPAGAPAAEEKAGAYDTIVARDLFSQTRGVAPPPTKVSEPVQPVKPQPQQKVTLFGVVIVDGEKSAFLQEGAGDAKPRKVREGEAFAGGKVTQIRPDGVTLQLASGEVSVPLRTPKEGAAGAPQLPAQNLPAAAVRPQPAVKQPVPAGLPGQPARQLPAAPVVPPRYIPQPVPQDTGEEEYFQEDLENGEVEFDEGEEEFEEEIPEGE